MAKKFAGFTPAQLGRIIPEMQGMQADEARLFLQANPAAARRVGMMSEEAQRRLSAREFQEGGTVSKTPPQTSNPYDAPAGYTDIIDQSQKQSKTVMGQILNDPTKVVATADVATPDDEAVESGKIDPTTGQLKDAPTTTETLADGPAPVEAPEPDEAATVDAVTTSDAVNATLDTIMAATGKPRDEALAEAATMSPEKLAQLGLTAAQIEEAQKVIAPDARKLEEGELIDGDTVDMDKVEGAVNFEAATGAPSSDATVQGQLTGLMEQFEGTQPPAWAAGAMRAAAAQMASRGLSASSMAGQALVQAAMESALPIAQMDAQTSAAFERQNLSNRQQAAMFAAEKRAQFLNLAFTQEFQARVQNAAKISDIANMNFSAEQQVALENARLAQSVDMANLNAENAKILADAAAMSQLDMANLSNRQQAQVQNAQAFLQMDMANLSNEQQLTMFKSQARVNSLMSDQAAENAARQFNASSENQTNQFFASLQNQVSMFNSEQQSRMAQFNAGEANAMARFNSEMINQRNQFNARNSLVIEQANAAWMQSIATAETAAINERNMEAARTANNFTNRAFMEMMQSTRDVMSFAWTAANNDADRATKLAIVEMEQEFGREGLAAERSASMFSAIGSLLAQMFV